MDESQKDIISYIRRIGIECFISNFDLFYNYVQNNDADKLDEELEGKRGYKTSGAKIRKSYAKAVISDNTVLYKALNYIIHDAKKISPGIREKAEAIMAKHCE